MSFGVKKTRNPIIRVLDYSGKIVPGLKCKGCSIEKPLELFINYTKTMLMILLSVRIFAFNV